MNTRLSRLALVSTLALAACSGTAGPSSPASPAAGSAQARASTASRAPLDPVVKVRTGSTGSAAESALYLALDRGYFKDEGIDFEFNRVKQGADALPSIIAGQLDIGTGNPVITYFNALSRAVDLKIVAYFQVTPPNSKSLVLEVRKDLIDSGKYKQPTDLKGMTLGLTNTGSLWSETALSKGGLHSSDVNIVTLSYPDMLVAFANKKIDAAMLVQPFGLNAEKQGLAQTVMIAGELLPGTPTTVLLYGPTLSKERRDVGQRFMVGFIRAQRDLHNAFELNQGSKDDIYRSLAKYSDIKDPAQFEEVAAQGQFSGTPANGEIDLAGLETFQTYYRATGQQKDPVDFGKAVDRSFADDALQQLGRV